MGFINLSNHKTKINLFMVLIVVLGLVFTVALFQDNSWSLEKVDGGLIMKQHNTMRKLLMVSMGTVTGDYDGDGNAGVGSGDGGAGREIGGEGGNGTMNRIGVNTCTSGNIDLNQGPTAPLPSGIPTYTVIVENICSSGCSVSDVHFSCEWFSSARTINPHIFRRIEYNDCLLNDGKPMPAGYSLSFQYANTFPFPLAVSKLTCL